SARSLARVFVLHPDPWPKTRHHKRRLINEGFLADVANALRPGGELRVASDIADYVRWTLVRIARSTAFDWTAESAEDWRCRPVDWPATRYEAKAEAAGRACAYLRFIRR
ncbi:MAG: tRNA (guanosine(46)-N7)-methyltransferase TrmB, partial [Pseudomonadota bacterium]